MDIGSFHNIMVKMKRSYTTWWAVVRSWHPGPPADLLAGAFLLTTQDGSAYITLFIS
jgi:hypothetical protein